MGIRKLAPNFRQAALAPDGLIEAFEKAAFAAGFEIQVEVDSDASVARPIGMRGIWTIAVKIARGTEVPLGYVSASIARSVSASSPPSPIILLPGRSAPISTFSNAVIDRNSRIFWNVRPNPAAVR